MTALDTWSHRYAGHVNAWRPAAASVTNDRKNSGKSSVDTYALAIMRILLRQPILANTAAMAHIPACSQAAHTCNEAVNGRSAG